MKAHTLTHLADHELIRSLATLVSQDRATTAALLAHLAEVDARQLYLPAAYPSMHAYCVGELRMSEDSAYKRIQAARAASRFPAIFELLAAGRLHLTSIVLLAPHLEPGSANALLEAATHRTKDELEALLAARFPRPDAPTLLAALPSAQPSTGPLCARRAGLVPEPVTATAPLAKVTPLAPGRYALQVTLSQQAHEKLRRAQELLGHVLPAGDIALVIERALDELVGRLEKRKFAMTPSPRASRAGGMARRVPAAVRRSVSDRDGGQCTFVSESGRRCEARSRIEFDHVIPVARGGEATVNNLRLRCRAHNQYAAEQSFGELFMRGKREHSREQRARAANARSPKASTVPATAARAGFN